MANSPIRVEASVQTGLLQHLFRQERICENGYVEEITMQNIIPALAPVPIAVAPNGGRRTKADHPALPITPADLARTAAECLEAGAAMIHVHVRDQEQQHLLDADAYRQAIDAIRAEVGQRMVIQITSESLGQYGPE